MNLQTLQRRVALDKGPSAIHLRAIIPNNFTSCLIGFGGAASKQLKSECNTHLQVFTVKGLKWGNVFSTKAQPEAISRGWYQCAKYLITNYHDFYKKQGFRIDFIFPSDLIDIFLSTGILELITRETNTAIFVKEEFLVRSTERILRICTQDLEEQSLHNFKTAVHLLARVVQENITIAMSSPGNVFYIQELHDDIWRLTSIKENYILFNPKNDKNDTNHPLLNN